MVTVATLAVLPNVAYLGQKQRVPIAVDQLGCTIDLFIFYRFLILIWLRSVFEADFHTNLKTKKKIFVWLNGFHVMR